MSKKKYSASEKLMVIKKYEEWFYTIQEIAVLFELSVTMQEWMRVYRHGGVEALETREGWTGYPKELKIQAVRDILEGRESLMSATIKFNISGRSVLRRWIAN